jgi:predicted transcriptional regulator
MSKKNVNLPTDYALVLQQIQEDGQDDILSLSYVLSINQRRVAHIVKALQHKGHVQVYDDAVVKLSRKGKRLMQYMWPEASRA